MADLIIIVLLVASLFTNLLTIALQSEQLGILRKKDK